MNYSSLLLKALLASLVSSVCVNSQQEKTCVTQVSQASNNCITFSVGSGTGCVWMCNYCANQLGTNNYYFSDNVCTYQEGVGCVGNPIAGKSYTCCSSA